MGIIKIIVVYNGSVQDHLSRGGGVQFRQSKSFYFRVWVGST